MVQQLASLTKLEEQTRGMHIMETWSEKSMLV
jgi:hypothetical protein